MSFPSRGQAYRWRAGLSTRKARYLSCSYRNTFRSGERNILADLFFSGVL